MMIHLPKRISNSRLKGHHCIMYYTHLYGEIRKSIVWLYMIITHTSLDNYPSKHKTFA